MDQQPMEKQPLILQLSFPFCFHQCSYCGYPSCKYDIPTMHRYAEAMVQELEAVGPDMTDYEVQAISMEGGSPAQMAPADLQEVLRAAKKAFHVADDAFISLQTMPGQYSRSLMDRMRDTGVNHWVVGLPTTADRLHFLLELPYNVDSITMVDTVLRNFHPHDVNFELLYGIPGQTMHDFMTDLDRVLVYAPEHMTLLPFRLEAGTKLAQKVAAGEITPMPAAEAAEMYSAAKAQLMAEGFVPYTVTDFARPGHENRYRLLELQGAAKLGAGYHALTAMEGLTYTNGHSLAEYLEHPTEVDVLAANPHALDDDALLERDCRNGLATAAGLNAAALRAKYSALPRLQTILTGILPQLQQKGYATEADGLWQLTPTGIAAGDAVWALF